MHILQLHASHHSTPTETVHSLVSNSHYSLVISTSYISNLMYTWTQPPTFPTLCTHGLNLLHFQPYVHMDSTSYISNPTDPWTEAPTFSTPMHTCTEDAHVSNTTNTHALKMPTFSTPPTLLYTCTEALRISNATNLGVHRQQKAQQAVRILGKRRKRGEIQKEEKEQTINQYGVWSPWKWLI